MNKLGININYSPVTDVEPQNNTGVLEGRCFGKDKNIIKKYATTMADTYIDMGICPCLKHIPGHFESTKDPHLNTLETDLSLEDITKEIEYLRFISNYPMAMTSHIKLNAIDNDYPLTVSQKSISTIIRGILDFDGFLISDAIDMHAVSGKIKEKTKLSLEAGVDAICYCSGKMEHLTAICEEKTMPIAISSKLSTAEEITEVHMAVRNLENLWLPNRFEHITEQPELYPTANAINSIVTG